MNILKRKLKINDKIKIISFPSGNGADGFAGMKGIVKKIDYNIHTLNGKGIIEIELDNKGYLVGSGFLWRLQYKLL